MVANYRCNEIKDEAVQAVQDKINSLKRESDLKQLDNFSERCKGILTECINLYDESASQY